MQQLMDTTPAGSAMRVYDSTGTRHLDSNNVLQQEAAGTKETCMWRHCTNHKVPN